MVTGLALYISMISSLVILFIMSPDKKNYMRLFFKSISWKILLTIIGVYMIQGVVGNLDGLIEIFQVMFYMDTLLLVVLFIAPIFFAAITGMHMAAIGIVIPILMALNLGMGEFMAYLYLMYCAAFIGYFYTPIHMCQIFTIEHMGVKMEQLYRVYLPFAGFMVVWLFASYFLLSNVLPMIFG